MKRKPGDRKDGIWLKDVDGFHYIMPHLMPSRCDSEVYIEKKIDVTELMNYLEEKNKYETSYKTTIFHAFVAAIGRVLYQRPYLNRFIAGKRTYQRNKMTIAFIVRRKFNDASEESLMVMEIDESTTIESVSKKIIESSKKIRRNDGNDINRLLNRLKHIPRWLMRLAMCIFRFLDFHGWMPESVCRGDSNYATVLLSNLGSIKCVAAYHHLNNYGTNSIVITIGKVHKEQVTDRKGKMLIRDVIDIGITADERIADGFYFAKSIQLLENILKKPELLDEAVKKGDL